MKYMNNKANKHHTKLIKKISLLSAQIPPQKIIYVSIGPF